MSNEVVHVIRSRGFAGVERYVVDVASELAERGWQVTVIGGDAARMPLELSDKARWVAGGSTPAVVRALGRVGRCDVVHAHMTAAEFAAVAASPANRARLVVTRHFAAVRGRTRAARAIGSVVRRRIDVQIAISEFVARSVGEASVVLPNGVRFERTEAVRERTVLVLQRLEIEKDTATAIRAWASSGLAHEGWRMVVHGTGAQDGELRALARDLCLDGSVEFAGWADGPRHALAAAGMLLATAPAEPFGLSVVEAMSLGTPVVASDAGAHRETLGEDGVWFNPGDVEACAAGLRLLAADSALRAQIGLRLHARFAAAFDLGRHVDELERLYREDGPV